VTGQLHITDGSGSDGSGGGAAQSGCLGGAKQAQHSGKQQPASRAPAVLRYKDDARWEEFEVRIMTRTACPCTPFTMQRSCSPCDYDTPNKASTTALQQEGPATLRSAMMCPKRWRHPDAVRPLDRRECLRGA